MTIQFINGVAQNSRTSNGSKGGPAEETAKTGLELVQYIIKNNKFDNRKVGGHFPNTDNSNGNLS